MGIEAEDIVRTFNLTSEEEKSCDAVLAKFDNYFKPKVNVIRMRQLFQRRIQERNENEEAYFRALHAAAEDGEFADLKKERIRDQFISGISDESLAEKLEHLYMSKQDNFNLDVVIEYTRTYCDIRTWRAMERQIKQEHIDAISHKEKVTSYQHNKEECRYCGMSHGRNSCPAYGKNHPTILRESAAQNDGTPDEYMK